MPAAAAIVVIGAGHAGGRAVEALRAAGHEGPLTLIGSELHAPYERPPLSKEWLQSDCAAPPEPAFLHPAEWYAGQRIELMAGRTVRAIERDRHQVVLDDGAHVRYDRLLLTTGARARRLAIPGADNPDTFYLRDLDDAKAIETRLRAGRRLVVIGAGLIGLEVAAAAARRGMTVTVLEYAERPLARIEPGEIGQFFATLHRDQGVELRTGIAVEALEPGPGGVSVVASTGEHYAADTVVVGIGSTPNTELAGQAGLEVEDGILVDAWGRTSDPSIYAAGDATRHFNPLLGRHIRLETWHNAQSQPVAVARAMLGDPQPYAEVPWFWTDQFGFNVQMAGVTAEGDLAVTRGEPFTAGFIRFWLRNGMPVGAVAVNNGRDMRVARQLIAARCTVDAAALADPSCNMRTLLPRG
jgi:NADPH-dependent 2,4-dienoyl-CoA reductase/sulfur reductase-like enzyme